jgi:hypothetical protein
MEEVSLNDEPDQIIWIFSSTEKFSVQSLYAVINNHGVKPVFLSMLSGNLRYLQEFKSSYGFYQRINYLQGIIWLREEV